MSVTQVEEFYFSNWAKEGQTGYRNKGSMGFYLQAYFKVIFLAGEMA